MEDQPLGKDISQKEKRLTPNLSFFECIPRYFARENRYLYQEEPGIFSRHADQQSGTPIRRADQTIQHLYLVTKKKEKKKIPYQVCRSTIRYPYLARQLLVFVTSNIIYGAGHRIDSLMVAQDA